MNNDLISRSELKKAFNKWWGCEDIPATVVEDIIDNAPTIEPNECILIVGKRSGKREMLLNALRPQGRWEYTQYDGNPNIGNWHCSNCHNICYEMKLAHNNYNFCPNCGADMRGEEYRRGGNDGTEDADQ